MASARCHTDAGLVHWRPESLWQGYAGLAVLSFALDAVNPENGWDSVGLNQLRRAVSGMEARAHPPAGLTGLSGLANAVQLLSRDGVRYSTLLSKLDSAIVSVVSTQVARLLRARPHGVDVSAFDVIAGLAGTGRYLLNRQHNPACRQALQGVLRALVYLSEDDGSAIPHWHTDFGNSTDNLARFYPHGHVNLGLAHGIPGPLALMSVSTIGDAEVHGQREAIIRAADGIMCTQAADEWGVNFPTAAPLDGSTAKAARSAWCYGAPGVARALWLAGIAVDRSEYRELAIAAMLATCRRPAAVRRIDSSTVCHGVAGLLQITMRFANDSPLLEFINAAVDFTTQVVRAYEPASRFGYRTIDASERRVDHPGFLDGAAGVALVLLAASSAIEPTWDRILLLS
ncbi:lanthionine synthetase C family protein [Nocardia takedensis]|uniref:lanthionine synthetase C family protein n=1 Tax=Nocardia takedensis TaxID=259390 RepID=UPI003F75B500